MRPVDRQLPATPTLATYSGRLSQEDCRVYLQYAAANKQWYPKTIKTYLLPMVLQWVAAIGGVATVSSVGHRLAIVLFRNGVMFGSYDPSSFKLIGADLIRKTRRPAWIKRYAKSFWRYTAEFTSFADKVYWEPTITDSDLLKQRFNNLVTALLRTQSYGYITEATTVTPSYWVTEHLRTLLPDISEEEVGILLRPASKSFLYTFHRLLQRAKTPAQLNHVLRSYYWVRGSYTAMPKLSLATLTRLRTTHQSLGLRTGELRGSKVRIIKRSTRPAELARFVQLMETLIAMHDERKANVLRMSYALYKLSHDIHRLYPSWLVPDILNLTPHEVAALLEGRLAPGQVLLVRRRTRQSAWLFSSQGYLITTDSRFFRRVHGLLYKGERLTTLRGYPASAGLVRGKVRVVLSEDDFHKVRVGDVLVTSMTRPEFMPALRKAAAFVTDEGSITCHAAIIAREMRKPCVIGTRVATTTLNDGDLVEVDASRGVVKKL